MIGIVIASDVEAAPFLTMQRWEPVETEPYKIFKGGLGEANSEAFVIISGIGKVAAAVATHLLICKYKVARIFNFGACGALKKSEAVETGAVFKISAAVEGDRREGPKAVLPEVCASDPFGALPAARLVTCDQPVFNTRRKEALRELGDLVDMEGAAIARVANMFALPCVLIKGVTDGAKDGDRDTLNKNIEMVSLKLAVLFLNTVNKLNACEE